VAIVTICWALFAAMLPKKKLRNCGNASAGAARPKMLLEAAASSLRSVEEPACDSRIDSRSHPV
jgi:hypothetical protein